MLDPQSGILAFTEPAFRVSPALTRPKFLIDPASAHAADLVVNEPWRSWFISPCVSGDMRFGVSIYFHDERLTMVRLTNIDPKFGTSWSEWSQQQEDARRATHDAWLDRCVGPQREFPWDRVMSVYDDKAGEATIVIKYRE